MHELRMAESTGTPPFFKTIVFFPQIDLAASATLAKEHKYPP